MAELNDWSIVAASNNSAPPDGWPENTMNYSEVNDTAREGMAVLARYFKDINGSLTAGGVANAYTLTLNANYTSYFTGLYVVAKFPATNTGAATLNVNGISVTAIKDRKGNDLQEGAIQANGIYELRYDGTYFQLMGTVGGTISLTKGTFDKSDAIDLVDTDVAIVAGSATPASSPHVEIDYHAIQAKTDATSVATLLLNPMGGNVQVPSTLAVNSDIVLGSSGTGGGSRLFHNSVKRVQCNASGIVDIVSDGNTDAETRRLAFTHQNGTSRAVIGQDATSLYVRNQILNGLLQLYAESSAGATLLFNGDPTGDTTMYRAGVATLGTYSYGSYARSATSGDARIELRDSSGTSVCWMRHAGSMELRNNAAGAAIWIQATKALGGTSPVFYGTPDGSTSLYYAGSLVAQTVDPAGGGFWIDKGSGLEEVAVLSSSITGNAATATTATTATTANNVNLSAAGSDTTMRLVISDAATGSQTLYNDTGLTYDASANIATATDWTATSDIALKENIEPLTDALTRLKKIGSYLYDRKDSGRHNAGVIAQEVQKVLPEAVVGNEGRLAVSTQQLLALAIAGINELAGRLDGITKHPADQSV